MHEVKLVEERIKVGSIHWLAAMTACLAGMVATCCSDTGGGHGAAWTPYSCLVSDECKRVMVAAHRGFHREHPENSLAGLRGAAEIGADFVEVDVRHTKDDVLVLMHDSDVDRTTDGSGNIGGMTWAQVQELKLLGCNEFIPDDCRVPRFDEALAMAKELGIMIYVDTKTDKMDMVMECIVSGGFEHTALVRTGDQERLAKSLEKYPQVLVMPSVHDFKEVEAALEAMPSAEIIEVLNVQPDKDLNDRIHGLGLKVQEDAMGSGDLLAAMSGDYSGWASFIESGVDLVQTDYPDLLVPAVRKYDQTGEFPRSGPDSGEF